MNHRDIFCKFCLKQFSEAAKFVPYVDDFSLKKWCLNSLQALFFGLTSSRSNVENFEKYLNKLKIIHELQPSRL